MSAVELVRWLLFVIVAWYVPGMVVSRLFFRDASGAVRLAVCWAASPVVFSVLAVILGVMGVDPVMVAGVIAGAGLIGAIWSRPWPEWSGLVRHARAVFLVPVLLGLVSSVMPIEQSLTADTNAHIAAVRRCVEERSVFPERGFHGDEESVGVDPRFGTIHAWNSIAARMTGLEPREVWHLMRGAGLALILAGALALVTTVATSWPALLVGMVALLATHGGRYYSILSVSAYPLWISLGIVWALAAFVLRSGFSRVIPAGLIAAVALAGLSGIHFFAYMLGGFLLGILALTAPREDRVAALKLVLIAALASMPWVGIRLATSYVNDNPIHQKIWQCMEWSPGLYSASPIFVAGWLVPFGVVALIWGAVRWRQHRGELAFRWLMWTAIVALAWICVPWLLTPSMELIGFLPLRLLMAVGASFILALLIDRLERRRVTVALVFVLLLASPLWQRVERLVPDAASEGDAWEQLVAELEASDGRPVVLSDPFTMLALSADAGVDVVAVPDGRSSPRDAQAIERLRDAWRGMSAAVGGAVTEEMLERRRVTHVVTDGGLPKGLSSYEYPVHAPSAGRQLEKFQSNPERFREVWSSGSLVLFEVRRNPDPAWDEAWLETCSSERGPGDERVAIGYGYEVAATARTDDAGTLLVEGHLIYGGAGQAPDRLLVIRLDRQPGSVPAWLAGVAKPVRKFRRLLGAPRERYRWETAPGGARCPTWMADAVGGLGLDLELRIPAGMAPGDYIVTLAARDRSVFEPIPLRDLFVDDDSWRGPTIATVEVE